MEAIVKTVEKKTPSNLVLSLVDQVDEGREDKELAAIAAFIGDIDLVGSFRRLVYGLEEDGGDSASAIAVQGTKFWVEDIEKHTVLVNEIREMYSQCQDEKRNFLTFGLTTVTVLIAPMAVLTGYWCVLHLL